MNRIRSLSIYQKIIITFLLVIIPLYAISLYVNELSTNALRREILDSMSSRVHFYKDTLEREFDNIYSLQNNLALDRKFQRFGVAGDYVSNIERSDLIHDIQRQLVLIKSSNQYIHEVRVHFFERDTTITASILYSDLQEEYVEPLLRTSQEEALLEMDEKLFLRMTYPESLSLLGEQKQPLFLIETEISVGELKDALSEFSLNGPEIVSLSGMQSEWMISNQSSDPTLTESNEGYLSASEASDTYQFNLTAYALEEAVIQPIKTFQYWFWLLSLVTLFIVLLFSYSINKMLHQPIKTLIRSFRKVETGQFEVRVERKSQDEFHYLYSRFNLMLEQINHLIKTVYEQRIRTQQAELKQLQSQINPHFLYNSLFVLNQMVVMQDYDNLEHFSKHLSDYFKMITRNAVQEVSMEEEVGFAQNYVHIQEFRFSNRVKVLFEDLPESVRQVKVPRLILQPIIENAFEHGMKNRMEQGLIRIAFTVEADWLTVTVEDNGEGLNIERMEELQARLGLNSEDWDSIESTGLINVHQRLLLKFGPPAGVQLHPIPEGGLMLKLLIPLGGGRKHVSDPGSG